MTDDSPSAAIARLSEKAAQWRHVAKACAADGTDCVHIGTVLLIIDELDAALRAGAEARPPIEKEHEDKDVATRVDRL